MQSAKGELLSVLNRITQKIKKYMFLFEELVKRDFKQKYKGTALGMVWSVLSPLLTLFVMKLVFSHFFGKDIPHYTIYLFSGNIIMAYFRESTRGGMNSLVANAPIFTKINVPKYMFLLSKNVSTVINFGLTLVVYFIFCAADGIHFGFHMLALIFPCVCLLLLNVGVGLILSALYVFFRDMRYLYEVFLMLLTYVSAIFYTVEQFPAHIQRVFLINPVYVYIKYFRLVVINGSLPSLAYHLLCAGYAVAVCALGYWIYKKNNQRFLYYV